MELENGEAALSKPRSVLLNRNFILLFSGRIISLLGDQIYAFALSWYILDITKSSLQMAIFLVIDTLAVAIVSPFGGTFADRLNRKTMMVWMDIIRGIIVLLAALLLYQHALQIWMLYISAIALGVCGSLFTPASGAIIPNIVDGNQITEATSMNQFSWSFCAIAGMLTGGLLYSLIGIFSVFILNAFSYLVSGVLEACIDLKPNAKIAGKIGSLKAEIKKVLRELREGYQYVRGKKLIFSLIIMFAVYNTVVMPLGFVYFPYLFNVILKATSFQLALAVDSIFIGMMAAPFLVPLFLKKFKLRDGIFWGLSAFCVCQILLVIGLYTPLRVYFDNWSFTFIMFFLSIILGLALSFFIIPVNIIFQKNTSDEYRGRFWGFYSSITALTIPAAYLLGGFLAQKVPIGFIFGGSAIIMFLLNLWVVNLKEVKELKE